ncbi:MAG TPA: homocysteine S-methyltransferase family protein [Candidatus Mcinerneyibacteriales bacterium]|nr:homocysteine S-methyltransferase family protein [Candidatus Mcinerneyibacteriales bacterium]
MKALLKDLLLNKTLLGDGAMGTSIQARLNGENQKGSNELLNITAPDLIRGIHRDFLRAGSDIIETNTFGASALSLRDYGLEERTFEINQAAAFLARKCADTESTVSKPRFVAGSIGPTGYLPSLGQVSFDTLYESYIIQCRGLIQGGIDYFLIETCQDLLQVKAALIAARDAALENGKKIPAAVSLSPEKGRLITGSDIETIVTVLEPFDLLYLGFNCGNGFEGLEEALSSLGRYSPYPSALMPNAGFPEVKNGHLFYSMTPEEYSSEITRLMEIIPLSLVGGCCGTTPAHIQALKKDLDHFPLKLRKKPLKEARLASLFKAVDIKTSRPPFLIGERSNTQGSKRFKELLLKDDFDSMIVTALEQERSGAAALDLCCVIPGRDEVRDLSRFVEELNRQAGTPLCLDTVNAEALEEALKRVSGKPLINSVHLKDKAQAEKIFTLARRFGASLICLAMDQQGMALTSQDKIEKAEKIYSLAVDEYGLAPEDLFFDMLTFTIASDTELNSAYETLTALKEFKKRHPRTNTILGVSNVSHGLKPFPRKILNSLFLQSAVEHGLDASLVHAGNLTPLHHFPEKLITLGRTLLLSPQPDSERLTDFLRLCDTATGAQEHNKSSKKEKLTLFQAIIDGRKEESLDLVQKELMTKKAENIIEEAIIPAMEEVGRLFESNQLQLPFVLRSSEIAKKALDLLSAHLTERKHKGTILLATVYGDVHDIGKNLSAIIFRNHGYRIVDIGVDRSAEEIIDAVKTHEPDAVGLSGLLANSAIYFGTVLSLFEKNDLTLPVLCGGAALTRDFTENHLAPLYNGGVYKADDAFDAIRFLRQHPLPQTTKLCEVSCAEKNERGKTLKQGTGSERVNQVHYPVETILPFLNKSRLFKIRWGGLDPDTGNEELARLLQKEGLYQSIKGVFSSYPCSRDRESLTLFDSEGKPVTTFRFPRDTSGENRCITDFFREEGDHITLFLVTAGPEIAREEAHLLENDSYYDYYLLHGLGTELAEAAAACLNDELKKKEGPSLRFGFGYPACPDLKYQETICRLLQAGSIGVSVTPSFQLIPELSTGGFMIHNEKAFYFPMKDKGGLQ